MITLLMVIVDLSGNKQMLDIFDIILFNNLSHDKVYAASIRGFISDIVI
jgi:hypothetical protein